MRDFLDGLTDDLGAAAQVEKRELHIVNGGTGLVACDKCGGSGMTRWGTCFRCQGKGQRTMRSVAASKAKVTREENLRASYAEWTQTPVGIWCLKNQDWNEFAGKMIESAQQWGRLTDGQTAAIERSMLKQAERRAEKAAAPKQEVSTSAIDALFATAQSNGLKSPKFYAGDMVISMAKPGSKNPGALYVKDRGEYAGKIMGGKFHPVYGARTEVGQMVAELAADPRGFATRTGQEEVRCCCCGKELTDPVSKANGIGPICADNWGF